MERPAHSPGVSANNAGCADAGQASTRMDMTHKFAIGSNVYFEPRFGDAAARGKYKIVRQLPIENDNRLSYRIKSLAESFERVAEEHQLSRSD
jgi:hypothetical protein